MQDEEYVFDRSDPEPTDLVAAPGDEVEPLLVEIATGVFAFLRPEPPAFGRSNVGLVIDGDGQSIVDTGATPVRGRTVRSAIETLTAELGTPLRRVVVTSSKVAFTGGSAVFWRAAFHGTEATSDELDQPANLDAIRRLLPELAPGYPAAFEVRPITHTIDEPAWLTPSIRAVPVVGEGTANLVAHLPGADVAMLGAIGSFGVRPLAFVGDPARWADTLDDLVDLASTFVPGHGTVGGKGDVADQAAYLRACVAADGDADRLGSGPWESWSNPEFDEVNVERAKRLALGDSSIPVSMFELLGLR